jgi:hypothetical protein
MGLNTQAWFAVRCVLHDAVNQCYEERITVWRVAGFDEAIRQPSAKRESTLATSRLSTGVSPRLIT